MFTCGSEVEHINCPVFFHGPNTAKKLKRPKLNSSPVLHVLTILTPNDLCRLSYIAGTSRTVVDLIDLKFEH